MVRSSLPGLRPLLLQASPTWGESETLSQPQSRSGLCCSSERAHPSLLGTVRQAPGWVTRQGPSPLASSGSTATETWRLSQTGPTPPFMPALQAGLEGLARAGLKTAQTSPILQPEGEERLAGSRGWGGMGGGVSRLPYPGRQS